MDERFCANDGFYILILVLNQNVNVWVYVESFVKMYMELMNLSIYNTNYIPIIMPVEVNQKYVLASENSPETEKKTHFLVCLTYCTSFRYPRPNIICYNERRCERIKKRPKTPSILIFFL